MKIALVSCSKKKQTYPCQAKGLYSASQLFSLSYRYAEMLAEKVYILSAKYGLVERTQVLAPYNLNLGDLPENRQMDWANYVLGQMRQRFDLQHDTFIILAGQNYYRNLLPHLANWELPLGNLQLEARIEFLQWQLQIHGKRTTCTAGPETSSNDITALNLHRLFNSLPRYHWQDIDQIPFQNGIYIMFEKGETYRGYPRIVRVGTHTSDGRLKRRLQDHFIKENKDGSIFRKNVGKAILNENHDPYLSIWSLDTSRMETSGLADVDREQTVERCVSQWLRENISFAVFEVESREQRLRMETAIIAQLHLASDFLPSEHWLGRWSPEAEIRESGMWLKDGLHGRPLTEAEYQWLMNIGQHTPAGTRREPDRPAPLPRPDGTEKIGTAQIREYLRELLSEKKKEGNSSCVLTSGQIHKAMGLSSKMPSVCSAMYQIMGSRDKILHTTPSGKSSTIKIEYYL